ncbi:DUF6069 family protein [Actinoplanes sp. NPDC049316]|uniref:DUF6069 family protein n=1 Tax=Actinoplanes sp. NPDC049316 TaxID=3154727 RepID=UPI00341451BD
MTELRSSGTSTTVPASRRRRARLFAVAGAVLAALLIWIIAVPVAGVDLQATTGPGSTELEPVPVVAVIAMSLLAPLAGWGLLALLERFSARGRTIWTVIACVVLLVSYGGPLLGAGIPGSSRLTLALMHTAVGLIVIPAFARSSHRR